MAACVRRAPRSLSLARDLAWRMLGVWAHSQELADPHDSEHEAHRERHEAALRIDEQLRACEMDRLVADTEIGFAGGHDVLHPLHARAVCEGEQVVIAVAEHVHRCAVDLAGLPAAVVDDRETRYAVNEEPRESIQDVGRERKDQSRARERDRCWHQDPRLIRSARTRLTTDGFAALPKRL